MPPLFEPDTHRFGGSCHVYTCEAREQSQRRQALTGVFIHTDRLVLTGLDGLRRSLVSSKPTNIKRYETYKSNRQLLRAILTTIRI